MHDRKSDHAIRFHHRTQRVKQKDNMENQDAAARGKDQRQGKQHPVSKKRGSVTPAESGRFQGSSGRSREDEDLVSISSQTDSPQDVEKLQQAELSGSDDESLKSANYSDTDEDEDEGLGDGNLGRSVRGGVEG
jgi:hypothetical protein